MAMPSHRDLAAVSRGIPDSGGPAQFGVLLQLASCPANQPLSHEIDVHQPTHFQEWTHGSAEHPLHSIRWRIRSHYLLVLPETAASELPGYRRRSSTARPERREPQTGSTAQTYCKPAKSGFFPERPMLPSAANYGGTPKSSPGPDPQNRTFPWSRPPSYPRDNCPHRTTAMHRIPLPQSN